MEAKIGIIGIGNIGFTHARAIYCGQVQGMRLCAVCDINPALEAVAAEHLPGVPFYTDYRQLLQAKLDGVIVAVPHPLHGDIAIEAFQAGKHVLVEKPADITVSKARRMNREAGDKVFGIMFNQRTGNLFSKARQIVRDGLLGQLKRADWTITNWYRTQHYYDSGSWRATWAGEGGGVLMNQAPHQLDLWQWICGMPESISADCQIGRYHDIEVEDTATILARFPGGATGCFSVSTGEYPGTNRLELAGTLGKVVIEEGKLKWWRLQEDERAFCKTCPISYGKIPFTYEEFEHEPTPGHRLILEDFARSVLEGTPLLAPGKEGILSLSIQNAAYLSSWKNGAWVDLPFDEEEFDRLLSQRRTGSVPFSGNAAAPEQGYNQRWQINW